MPSITKAEYERLKRIEKLYESLVNNYITQSCDFGIALRDADRWKQESEKWKRYYDAVRETLRVEETVEIPTCFKMTDSINYIVKMQETECRICFDEEGSYVCIRPSHEAYRRAKR